jgi:hypothetical protein
MLMEALLADTLGAKGTARRRVLRRWAWCAASAAAVLVAFGLWRVWVSRPPAPRIEFTGEYTLYSQSGEKISKEAFGRGSRVVTGNACAALSMEKQFGLKLEPATELVWLGEPGKEVFDLKEGKVTSKVEPDKGRFTLRTPRGRLEVVGTEFVTEVRYRGSSERRTDMDAKRWAMVSVVVLSGAVACYFDDYTGVLSAGMSRTFAAEQPGVPDALVGFRGMMIATLVEKGENQITVKVERITRTWEQNKARNPEAAVGQQAVLVHTKFLPRYEKNLAELKPGDRIEVEALYDDAKLYVGEVLRKAAEAGTD